jgi:hypothetical protein
MSSWSPDPKVMNNCTLCGNRDERRLNMNAALIAY